jgi:glycerate kinase
MRVLIAPDKFKGCLPASAVVRAIAGGVRRSSPDATLDECPLADGGEGTLDALLGARPGQRQRARVTGPLGSPVDATWGLLDDGSAVVESALAAGIGLVPRAERNPLRTTSYGVGELILRALDSGARRVVVGLGGSATNDGGAGLLQALGVRFEPSPGAAITGRDLLGLSSIDARGLDARLRDTQILAACDVDSPLFGVLGAAYGFARQKGADASAVAELDQGLRHLASLTAEQRPIDPEAAGAGAAGGMGFGLLAFCGAEATSGAELILDQLGVGRRIAQADLVFTGEGALDAQTLHGKVVSALARRAQAAGVPLVVLTGSEGLPPEQLWEVGIAAAFTICDAPISQVDAESRTEALLSARAAQVFRLWSVAPAQKRWK